MRKTCNCGSDILIDIIHTAYSFAFPFSIMCLCKSVDLCTDAISLSSDALPLTHTLSLSLR
jgi:hypothetical protein